MTITRRTVFAGLAASIATPAIIRTPGLLMPIKPERFRIAFVTAADLPEMTVFLRASDDGVNWSQYAPKSRDGGAFKFHIPKYRYIQAVSSVTKWPQALSGDWPIT